MKQNLAEEKATDNKLSEMAESDVNLLAAEQRRPTSCLEVINPSIRTSRSAKPTTSPKVENRGVSEKEAERHAWATVNKDDGGGKKQGGTSRGKHTGHPAAHKRGEKGGKASGERTAAEKSASAKSSRDP